MYEKIRKNSQKPKSLWPMLMTNKTIMD